MEAGLLTGGFDRPYAFGLAMALVDRGVRLDVIGGDAVDSPEMHCRDGLTFLNIYSNHSADSSALKRLAGVLLFYARLLYYAACAKPKIFHILWNNKLAVIDRTLLMLYYKGLRRKIILTAHNVNAGKRDQNDSILNCITLKIQYRLADHIFVHTDSMKSELCREFHVPQRAVTVIPFGINNSIPETGLTTRQAKGRLSIGENEKTVLFFGAIRPYKGLECLVAAFEQIATGNTDYRLIIAGERKKGSEKYLDDIQQTISRGAYGRQVLQRIEFIADEAIELYFKAADVLVLPYTHVFQSGVQFLAYAFGLPVIATDVGNFRDDILSGETGFVCKPGDPVDLARTIEKYFESELFKTLEQRRQTIRNYFGQQHSWDIVGEKTAAVYAELLGARLSRA